MKYLLTLVFLLNGIVAFSQNTINGTISGLPNEDVYLLRVVGDNQKIVDTAFADMTGSFEMELQRDFPTGLYAIVSGKGNIIELIFNNENIRFVTGGNTPDAQVQIIESIENLIYYDYLSIKGTNLYKLDLLEPVLQYYPKDDDFYIETVVKVRHLQKQLIERANQLVAENPNTLASHFIRADKPVFAEPEIDPDLKKQYIIQHYFDEIDFTDSLLMRSNILTSRIVKYLSLYQEQGLTQEELEGRLLVAVDTVLEKAFVDQKMYEHIINFLIGGFEAIGFERGLEHIANQNMLNELCVNTERKAELENKMELIKKLAIGQPAPDFEANDLNGNQVKLSNISAKKMILFFWASWCPHCENMLPELLKMYDAENTGNIQIVAISIDESDEDLKKLIAENKLDWINIAELKGWDGPIVEEYGIVATPTLFVLDENKVIIAKPGNIKELKKSLK